MIDVFINDLKIENFSSKEIYRDIELISGSVYLESNADSILPININDKIRVLVNGIPKLNGYIDNYNSIINNNGHKLIVEGRDKIQDLLDSTLKEVREFQPPISLTSIIRSVLDDLGLTDVLVVNNVTDLEDFQIADLISGEDTQNAFDFIHEYAKKRQVLLTSDGDGNIVLQRSTDIDILPGLLQLQDETLTGTTTNNIKSSSLSLNNTERYGIYIARSQSNLSSLADILPIDTIDVTGSDVFDNEIRQTRFLAINPENSSDNSTNTKRAQWEANLRKTKSFEYKCTVVDHSLNGIVFDINKLINVKDDKQGIIETLLIKDVNYVESLQDGTITELTLVKKDSYKLEV